MTTAIAEASFGIEVKQLIGETYTAITNVRDITGLDDIENDVSEVTCHSTTSRAKRKIVTLKGIGDIGLEVNYIPADASHKALRDAANTGLPQSFQLILSDSLNTTLTVSAYVKNWKVSGPVQGERKASVTLTVDGDSALTDDTSP